MYTSPFYSTAMPVCPGSTAARAFLQAVEKFREGGENFPGILPGSLPFSNNVVIPATSGSRLPAAKKLPCLALDPVSNHGVAYLACYRDSQSGPAGRTAGGNNKKIPIVKLSAHTGKPDKFAAPPYPAVPGEGLGSHAVRP
jgi:hypothetical protein